MSVRSHDLALRPFQRRFNGELLWGLVGLGCATASAAFAVYMIAFGPATPGTGSHDFGIFAQFDRRARFSTGPVAAGSDPAPAVETTSPAGRSAQKSDGVDFTPTGSIGEKAVEGRGAPPDHAPVPRIGDHAAPLPGFVLRDVFDGKALIEARSRLQIVTAGSMLEGAGLVRSIERQGPNWVVLTADGVIVGQAR